MPPRFAAGLDQWSSGDGTPGSDTYENAANAAFVPADQDFGGALELVKTESVQHLRHMGQTPILPGCYLQVRARVKALSGALPAVRIAAWAGGAGDVHVAGLPEAGPAVPLTQYGEVVEVRAIIGIEDWERKKPQPILIDIDMACDARAAAAADDILPAVNYRSVAKAVER